jgi:PTH1 family peptidyl-tRNA hydrolase
MNSSSESNWLIVGLGNPGLRYEKTRHNLGFMLIDRLAREFQTSVKREECRALIGRVEIENQIAELISDDLALPIGVIRLRPKGSAGGHNGLKSLIACLGTDEFFRLRIGIQPEHALKDTKNFVLENFSKTDLETIEKVLQQSAEAIRAVLVEGIEKAMARFN